MKNQITKRFLTLSILAIATIFSLSFQTKAVELLTNGSFEENLVGWTQTDTNTTTPLVYVYGVGAGRNLFDNMTPLSSSTYLHNSFAQDGSRSCLIVLAPFGVPDVTVTLYQNITVPANTTLTVSWKQRYSQNNSTAISQANPRLRLVIKNPTTGAILQTPYQQLLSDRVDEVTPWTTKTYNLGNTYAGQTIRLEFIAESYDENAPNYQTNRGLWEIDAVSANALPPTAAQVSLSGKIRDANGKAMSQVRVRIMDMNGDVQSVLTNKFGYYEFREIEAGQTYAMEAFQKGVRFINNPRIINVIENLDAVDFYADDPTISR